MTKLSDTEVKQKGLGDFVEALGEVDAERFIMLLIGSLLIILLGKEISSQIWMFLK